MTFPSTCGACAVSCETRMFLTKIPYFQEVIVMASTCDACGYRNSEELLLQTISTTTSLVKAGQLVALGVKMCRIVISLGIGYIVQVNGYMWFQVIGSGIT